jgi:predicted nucleic acid-binding Zn ribbon protein
MEVGQGPNLGFSANGESIINKDKKRKGNFRLSIVEIFECILNK